MSPVLLVSTACTMSSGIATIRPNAVVFIAIEMDAVSIWVFMSGGAVATARAIATAYAAFAGAGGPLGVAGGIAGLALLNVIGTALPLIGLPAMHQPFDMISMLGFLILMGTVVNNPILIVDRAMRDIKEQRMPALDAVREAVSARLRPIAMSTLTTICGLSPLVFIPGAGTELYRGVGAIVLFGILGAAVVSLTMLPALSIALLQRGNDRRWPPTQPRLYPANPVRRPI